MTPFHIEHEFLSPSIELFWRCFLDEAHVAVLDAEVGVRERVLVTREETDELLVRSFHMYPARELPGFIRRVTRAGLDYVENSTFHKRENRIEIEIVPSLFASRTTIKATYLLVESGEGRLLRTFDGMIDVRVPMIGSRVERTVIKDMVDSYEHAAAATQSWLDRHAESDERTT